MLLLMNLNDFLRAPEELVREIQKTGLTGRINCGNGSNLYIELRFSDAVNDNQYALEKIDESHRI